MSELAIKPDAVLVSQVTVRVPDSLESVKESLGKLGEGINAGGWATAAVVYAWTEERPAGFHGHSNDEKSSLLSLSDFAALGIRGLTTRDSVRKYRHRWEVAIQRDWAKHVEPGMPAKLPDRDFREKEAHVGANSGDNEWFTPPEYIVAAVAVMGGIDLDPASTPKANTVVNATQIYTVEDDGLQQEWYGRVWMNPPYAQPAISHFADKLVSEYLAERVTQAVVLVNNASETAWFATMNKVANGLCQPTGRVRFWHPDKKSAAPLQGQSVLYFGEHLDRFRREFGQFGRVRGE